MGDFGEQAWDEGFDDPNDYLDHLMDQAASELNNQDDYQPDLTDFLGFGGGYYHRNQYQLCSEKVDDKHRFYHFSNTEKVTVAEFDYIGDCSHRFVKIMNNNKWGFFDSWDNISGEHIDYHRFSR